MVAHRRQSEVPGLAGVIPRRAPTIVAIDERDAAALLSALPGLPCNDDELRPVTLDAGEVVRVRGGSRDGVKEVALPHSTAAGPAIRVALDRRLLARALSPGCRTWKLTPDKPVVAGGGDVTFIAAQLEPALVAPPSTHAPATHSPDTVETQQPSTLPERNDAVKPPETNGHPSRDEPPDPLTLAEELRDALTVAATKAARLVGVMRATRKEKRALACSPASSN